MRMKHIPFAGVGACRFRASGLWVLLACVGGACGAFAEGPATHPATTRLPKVGILPGAPAELFTVEVGAKAFVDRDATLVSVAPELRGLNGVRMRSSDTKVDLDSRAPVQLLVGIFRGEQAGYARAPAGKTPVLTNGAIVTGMPAIDVYAVDYEKGKRAVSLGGACIVLGVIPAGVAIEPHDAGGGAH
jgi:hypothetical protein